MCDRKGLLFGLFLGGLAGMVAGMLLAPERGEDTRQKLREQARTSAEEFSVRLKDGAQDFVRMARDRTPGGSESEYSAGEHELEI